MSLKLVKLPSCYTPNTQGYSLLKCPLCDGELHKFFKQQFKLSKEDKLNIWYKPTYYCTKCKRMFEEEEDD